MLKQINTLEAYRKEREAVFRVKSEESNSYTKQRNERKQRYVKRKIWNPRRPVYPRNPDERGDRTGRSLQHYKDDPEFNRELTELLNEYAGRPSRLYYAAHMTEDLGGAKVYLKKRKT